jgi:hypothetical protein
VTDCATTYRPVLSSERVPQDEQQKNCPAKERKKKNLVMGSKGVPDIKTTENQSQLQLNSTQLNSTILPVARLYSNEKLVGLSHRVT